MLQQPQQQISPTASPERQVNNQDPFASFAPGPTMPNVAQPPQQPPQQQQDPWATHMMTTAAPPAQAPAPMLAHAPLQPQMNGYVAPPVQQMPTYTAPAPVQQPTYCLPNRISHIITEAYIERGTQY